MQFTNLIYGYCHLVILIDLIQNGLKLCQPKKVSSHSIPIKDYLLLWLLWNSDERAWTWMCKWHDHGAAKTNMCKINTIAWKYDSRRVLQPSFSIFREKTLGEGLKNYLKLTAWKSTIVPNFKKHQWEDSKQH